MNKYLRSVYTCVEMQEATPTHNIISLRAMFAQYYNSAKGTSAKWLKDQRRGCQEGEGEHETTDNGFLMPFVLLFCKSLIQIGYFISRTFLFIDYIHEQQRCSSYSCKENDVLESIYSTYMQLCKMFQIWNVIDSSIWKLHTNIWNNVENIWCVNSTCKLLNCSPAIFMTHCVWAKNSNATREVLGNKKEGTKNRRYIPVLPQSMQIIFYFFFNIEP